MSIYYFVAAITGASTIVIWLGKLIITKAADATVEKYKSELVKDLEIHKAELSKITLEHQVMFSKLHEQRAKKIKSLYNQVRRLEKALKHSTTVFQGPEVGTDKERDDNSLKEILSLTDLLDLERIYFSESTISKVDSIISKSSEILKGMKKVRFFYQQYNALVKANNKTDEQIVNEMHKWQEVDSRMDIDFKELKYELANEFRHLLGIYK